MILTGKQIVEEVKHGNITIDPFEDNLVNPNSYNYRLGIHLYEIVDEVIDCKKTPQIKSVKTINKNKGCILCPRRLYLGSTYEIIGSDKFVPILIGRSSLGRLGLFLQVTSDLGHIGTRHNWTLELVVVQPLIVYPMMKIGQISFWKPDNIKLLTEFYTKKHNNYSEYFEAQVFIPDKFFDLLIES